MHPVNKLNIQIINNVDNFFTFASSLKFYSFTKLGLFSIDDKYPRGSFRADNSRLVNIQILDMLPVIVTFSL